MTDSKLNSDQVIEARQLARNSSGVNISHLSRRYDISRASVYRALTGVTYSWVKGEDPLESDEIIYTPLSGENHGRSKLSAKQVEAIRESTLTGAELARSYSVSPSTITRIRQGDIW